MKALLDTNIIIHREANKVINQDIGILFKWLEKTKYTKCVHPSSVNEIRKNLNQSTVDTFNVKLGNYEVLKTIAGRNETVDKVSLKLDITENDKIDTQLLNEVYSGRVDILISEDKKIHAKAAILSISDKVFSIDSFLEKVVSEHPDMIDYKVLSIKREYFGNIDLNDTFFDSLKEDYSDFSAWFNKKAEEKAYVSYNNGKLLAFLYLKVEGIEENYGDVVPILKPKKQLKIGTFKVISNGVRLGERLIKIIFDNALNYNADEIYATIFDKNIEQRMLINLLEDWGFVYHGLKGEELLFVRDFTPKFNILNPKLTYPFISEKTNIFLVPIYPKYHKELFPDSFLRTNHQTILKKTNHTVMLFLKYTYVVQ